MNNEIEKIGIRTVYIVKYALTTGILKKDLTVERNGKRTYAHDYLSAYQIGIDAFLSEEEAIQAADRMRDRKIVSLKKQIKKLEKLTF